MADRISKIYANACKKGVLNPEKQSEDWFRQQISTEKGQKSFYDFATQNGMKFHPYPEWQQHLNDPIDDQPAQPAAPSAPAAPVSQQPQDMRPSFKDHKAPTTEEEYQENMRRQEETNRIALGQPAQPVQGREIKMEEVVRPHGFENVSDEDLNAEIAQLSGHVHEQKARELFRARYGRDYVEPEEPTGNWWQRNFGRRGEAAYDKQRYADAYLDAARIAEQQDPGQGKRRSERLAILQQEKAYRDRQEAMPKLGEEIKDLQQRILTNEKQDGVDMRGAKHLLNQTIDLYNAPSKYGRSKGVVNWGKGLADQITDYDTWTAGVTELARYGNLNGIVNKMNKNEKLTKEEELLLETFLMSTAVQDMRSDLSTGYEIGKGAAESIPFMVEMYLTAGAGAAAKRGLVQLAERKVGQAFAEKLARSLGGTVIRDAAGHMVERGATRTVAGKVGKTLAYDFTQTAVMPSTYANIYKDRVSETLQGDGNYGFMDLARSFTGQIVETGTERWGGRIIDRGMSKMIPIDATALWGKNKLFGHFVENYINSPIGETGEEVIAAGVNTLRSFNPFYSNVDEKSVSSNQRLRGELGEMLSPEGLGKTFLIILPMSVFGGGANAAINRMAANAVVKDYGQSRQALQGLLQSSGATAEEASRIVSQIEASDSDRAFFDKMSMTYNNLLNKYMAENPNAPIEDVKAYQQQLDQVLGDYTKQAGAYNQMVGELMEKYEQLPEEEKRNVDSAMEDYMVRSAEELAAKQQQPQDRQAQLRQQAEQAAQQEIQSITHKDGNVYRVGIKGKDGVEGYAMSGALDIQQAEDGTLSTRGRDLITIKMTDGTVEQVPADEVRLLDAPASAADRVQAVADHLFAQYANNDLFQIGDKVHIMQDGQPSEDSSTIVNITDEGVEVEIIDPNGQPNTTVIPHEQAAEMLSKAEGTEDGIVTFTMQDGNTVRLRDMGDGTFASIVSEGEQPEIFTEEELAEAGAVRAESVLPKTPEALQVGHPDRSTYDTQGVTGRTQEPAYPTDEEGNPAWNQIEVPQAAQILYDTFKQNNTAAISYADDQLKEAEKVQKKAASQKSHSLNIAQRIAEDEQNAAFKAAADAAVKYWQNVKQSISQIKSPEEIAAEEEKRAKDAAIAAARRKTEEGLVGGQPAERWNNAPKIVGNAVTRTLPDGTKIAGHYVLAEAGAATPSHNPFNQWNTSEGFPVTKDGRNINERDYKNDKDAQQITMQIAQTYDGQAVQQVPVVSSIGIVYDGNGRTIAGNIAAANNTDAAYLQALTENAANFGFTPEQVASMQHPRIYLQTDEDMPYNTTTFAKFNAQEKKTMNSVQRAISNAKKLTDAARDGLLRVINSYSSLDAFFASEAGAKSILNLLQSNNIITEQEAPEWRDNTETGFVLSADGRSGITDLLIGALFDEQAIRMLGNDKGLKQSILRALPSIVENRRLGDYALTDDINEAIRLLYEARQANMVYKLFVRQGNLIDGYVKDRFSAFSMLLAEEMSSGVDKFRQVLDIYNDSARDEANGQSVMFDRRTPEDIKNQTLKRYEQEQQPAEPAGKQPARKEAQPSVPSTPASNGPKKVVPDRPNSKQLQGMSYNVAEAEDYIGRVARNILDENGYEDVEIVGIKVIGSRVNGNAREDSDLDAIIEFKGNAREDALFNLFADENIELDGIKVDINPITEGKSGTIEQFMRRSDEYLAEKAATQALYDALAQAEAETDTNPTEAQKKAENYKQGHVTLWGLPITIENPKGSIRRGTDANGKQWEQEMHHTYGKIRRTEGVDGDHIDVFIGPNLTSDKVFVVDQRNVNNGEFDEHKVMLGFDSLEDAQNGYLSNYEEGWQGMGTVTEVTMDEFKKWIDSSHRKTKPFAEYKSVKPEGAASVGYEEDDAMREELAEELRKFDMGERSPMDENLIYDTDDMRNAVTDILKRYNSPRLQAAMDAITATLDRQRAAGAEWLDAEDEEQALIDTVREVVGDKATSVEDRSLYEQAKANKAAAERGKPVSKMKKEEILAELEQYAKGNLFDMTPRMAKRILSLSKKYGKNLPEPLANMADNAALLTGESSNKVTKNEKNGTKNEENTEKIWISRKNFVSLHRQMVEEAAAENGQTLTDEEKKNWDWLSDNIIRIVDEYKKANGNVLDPDAAREYFSPIGYDGSNVPQYRTLEKALVDALYSEMLDEALAQGKTKLVLLTGHGGAGESTATRNNERVQALKKEAGVVFDAAMNSFKSLNKRLEQAIKHGVKEEDITIIPVYNDVVTSFNNSVQRGKKTGRVLSIQYLLNAFAENEGKLARVRSVYPSIAIKPIDNSGNNGGREASIEEALQWNYGITEEIINQILDIYEQNINEGGLTPNQITSIREGLSDVKVSGEGVVSASTRSRIERLNNSVSGQVGDGKDARPEVSGSVRRPVEGKFKAGDKVIYKKKYQAEVLERNADGTYVLEYPNNLMMPVRVMNAQESDIEPNNPPSGPEPTKPRRKQEQTTEQLGTNNSEVVSKQPRNQQQANFESNTVFTADAVAEARKRIAARRNHLNMGIDLGQLLDYTIIGGAYVEQGVRKFTEFCKTMIADFGDDVRPYLQSVYDALRHDPRVKGQGWQKDFDSHDVVDNFDVDNFAVEEEQPAEEETEPAAERTLGTIRQSKNTKTGAEIYVVSLTDHVSDAEFKVLQKRARANGGYYSKFAKNRGFIFNTEEDAKRFNTINDEEVTDAQTSANTEAVISQAETVAAEAAAIERTEPDDSAEEGVIIISPEVAPTEEEFTERQEAIEKIDAAIEQVNEQLAVLGYYEADTNDPSKWNESYGFIKTAEAKALKDIDKLAKQLAADLGIEINKRKKIASANLAPAGGDISFRLPLNEEGKELYINIDITPNESWRVFYNAEGSEYDLVVDGLMWRVEDTKVKGFGRYLISNQIYREGPDGFKLKYKSLLDSIRRQAKNYLPEVKPEQVDVPELPANPTMMDVVEQAKARKEAITKKRSKNSVQDGQQVLLLFDDVVEELNEGARQKGQNSEEDPRHGYKVGDEVIFRSKGSASRKPQKVKIVDFEKDGRPVVDSFGTNYITEIADWDDIEPINTEDNGRTEVRNDGQRKGRTQKAGSAGQPADQNGTLGGSQRQANEGTQSGGVGSSSEQHRVHDGERGLGTAGQRTEQQPVAESERKNTRNFRYDPNDPAPTSPKARYEANLAAIRLLKQLQDEGRQATPEEQRVLAKFTGWGGLGEYFNGGPGTTYYAYNGEKSPYQIIKELLTDEELAAAQLSRNSAYYTPTAIIDQLWNIAERLGFKGGNILEGSAGIGNILAQMPQSISDRSNLQAVEIDDITAGILAQLYPDAETHHSGFEKVDIPNNSQDLVITNVPFVTGLRVHDPKEKDLSNRFRSIHDFCIAKNVRKLRQGGIGIFITTSGTLDNSKDLRAWLNTEGETDVIGAFRLNRETFGGTSATSDIIVVRKRVNGQQSPNAINVLDTAIGRIVPQEQDNGKTEDRKLIYNRYFVEHPENMGGEMAYGFEHGDTWRGNTAGCFPSPSINQSERLNDFVDNMSANEAQTYTVQEPSPFVAPGTYETYEGAVPYGSLILNSKGEICRAYKGMAVPVEGINPTKVKGHEKSEVLKDYNALKAAVEELLTEQAKGISDEGFNALLKKLNKVYDDFVKKYGYLNRNVSLSFLRNDVQWASMAALENVRETIDRNGKKKVEVTKTDVFSKRVVGVQPTPKADNAKDGVILSVQQYGNVRPDRIAEWLGKPQDEVEKEIIASRLAFRDPQTGNMVVSHEYLSGNVREKLAYAEEHNENGEYDTNIEELRKVIPVDIPAHLIEFNIGSTWIPVELYHEYLKEKFGVDSLQLTHVGSAWLSNEKSWGTYSLHGEKNRSEGVYSELLKQQIYGHQLMIAAMNNVPVVVSQVQKHYDGSTETITDKVATAACSDKISQIKDDFVEWARGKMQQDPELAERVQKIYNERFNAIVPMLSVDKAFLSPHLPGQNPKYTLYDHQQQAVVRGTTQPIMLAHEVGTGKTITLISTAMEMRRLGTAKKPMIVVQNATTPQFVKEAKDLYPNAKILTVSERDRTKEGRQEFYAKIKYNDWDLIIVPQSVFDMIPDSEARMRDFIQDKIDEKLHAIEAAKEAKVDEKVTKRMERELEALKEDLQNANMSGKKSSGKKSTEKDAKKEAERIANATAQAEEMLDRRTDEVEDFDDMGIDALLIDEAHNYKHLGFATMMTRGVKGIDPSYSKRAAALFLKCQSIYDRKGHRNVVFATGTPISNTAAEIWTFMKYLMPKSVLQENDIYYFDDFVHNFGKIAEQLEFATNGKFKANNRFAQYGNVPELMRLWLTCADCVLTREVGQVNDKVPELEGGKAQDIFLPQSPSLIDIMASVREELDRYEHMSGKEKKENSHIPLTMYGVAKRAAIDPRLVDATAADEPLSKTNKAVEETLRSLKETKKYNGTVAIFCDSYRNLQSGFNLFEDIKAKLVKGGVPAAKIAIIRSEMTDAAKQKIFDAVREGEIRVIMGSTQTLGTGVNIQTRLHTLIHMDAPDRPMDYTQRNGRIIRQGNMHRQWNIPVRVLRFGVEDSLDVTSYQRLKTKAGFIDSIMNGKSMIDNNLENRVIEDVEEGIFDNPVAMLSGSQYALLKSQAERDLRKWQARKQQHDIDQILIASGLKKNAQIIEYRKNLIAADEKFLQQLKETFPTGKVTEYNINGTICHTPEELKAALKAVNKDISDQSDALRKHGYEGDKRNIGLALQFNGMTFNVNIVLTYKSRWEGGQRAITIDKEVQYTSPTSDTWLASPTKVIDKLVENIEQDYLSGAQAQGEINYSRSYIARLQQESELMRQREGKPFEHTAELERAQALVDEYTEKMKAELAEKEAKYANQSSGRKVELNEQEDEEESAPEAQIDNLDYPQFTNQTEAQQLATRALIETLNDNTDLDVFLATDEQMPEDGSETSIKVNHNSPYLLKKADGTFVDPVTSEKLGFDHSFNGRGEGSNVHGYGTYVSVEDIKGYAKPYSYTDKGRYKGLPSYAQPQTVEEIPVNVMLLNSNEHTNLSFDEYKDWCKTHISRMLERHRYFGVLQGHRFLEALYNMDYIDYDTCQDLAHEYFAEGTSKDGEDWLYKLEARILKGIDELKEEDFELPRKHHYDVEIPDNNGTNYLEEEGLLTDEQFDMWGKAWLSLTPNKEKEQVRKWIGEIDREELNGREAYTRIAMYHNDKKVSQALNDAGFTGIHYFGGRDGECYVIFNENDAKITDHRQFMRTSDGTLYGWAIGDRIYLTKAGLNPNTPIHEYTHLWAKAMRRNNQEGWQSIVNIFKDTPFWQEVVEDENYASIRDNDDAICSEVLARYSGTRGAARMEEAAAEMLHEADQTDDLATFARTRRLISRVRQALSDFWHWVGVNLFGIKHFDSADQVADRVLFDMLNGTELKPEDQTTTNNFKAWFGDWQNDPEHASKVVDKKGRPLVVYHGSPYTFTEFRAGRPIYAFNKRNLADQYRHRRGNLGVSMRPAPESSIVEGYMNLRNPFIFEVHGAHYRIAKQYVDYQLHGTPYSYGDKPEWISADDVVKMVQEDGRYDGVIFKDMYDNLFSTDKVRGDVYVAFDPNQIKSVNNSGEFSTEDDDIERSVSKWTPEQMRAIQEWNEAHPHPQYQVGEKLDHYAQRLNQWEEARKQFRASMSSAKPSAEEAEKADRPVAAGTPAFVPGVKPTPTADESPAEYALRLKQYYQLMRDENMVADYVAEINAQADAAAKGLKKNTLVRGLLDAAKPIENFQEWMTQRGATMTDGSNAYTDTFLASGRVSQAHEQLTRDILRPLAKQIATIIAPDKATGKSRLDGINITWQNMDVPGTGSKIDGKALTPREIIGVYCQAKDCAEAIEKGLPDRGAKGFERNLGMTHDQIIAEVESRIPRAELDEMWRLINAATHFALNYDYESGRISEDTHTEFYQREFYVPQRGWRERDESALVTEYEPVGKRGHDPYNAALVKAHGRQSLAADPFAYIMSIDASSIISSENNKIKQKFLRFCLDNEDLGLKTGAFRIKKYWIMNVIDPETGRIKLDADGNPMMEVSYSAPSTEDLQHDKETKQQIQEKRKQLSKVRSAFEKQNEHGDMPESLQAAYETKIARLEQAIEYLENQMHIAWHATNTNISQRTSDEKKQHEVQVLLDGEKYVIELQDEKLANAINKKFKQHQESLFDTTQKMRNATRFMSAMLTQYNPEFAASNFARDYQVALATLMAEHRELVGPFMKYFATCQGAVWKYAFNDKVRDQEAFADSEMGKYLREYFASGAPTGFSYMQDLKSLRRDFDAMVNESNVRRGIKGAVGVFAMLTEVSETAVRFAGFVAARKNGMGLNEAAYLSKELTTNFDRAGEVADTGWMAWFSFFRATLNGNLKFLKALKKMPLAYSLVAVSYFAMGMLNQFLNPDDPEDEIWASDYTRQSNFVLGKIRVPVAHFMRMFFGAGVNAAQWIQGNKTFGHAVYNTATFASQEMLPNYLNLIGNGTEWNSREGNVDFTFTGLIQGAMPSPVSPITDVWFNRDFRGATINREPFTKAQEGKKDILMGKEHTLPVYKWLTQAVYEGVGGSMNTEYKSADPAWRSWLFDISPSSVEHVVEGYIPAGADMFITMGEAIYDAATGTPTGPDKWPFVRKFWNAYTPERAYNQQYYLLSGRVKAFEQTLKDYQKNDPAQYRLLRNSQQYRTYQQTQRLVKSQSENPTTADVRTLIEANKLWLK